MEKNIVLNGNKLIAEFMGYRYIPFNDTSNLFPGWWKKDITHLQQRREGVLRKMGQTSFLCRRHHELRYWNSWDWLMQVVDKIKELEADAPLSYEFTIKFNKVLKLTLEESKREVFTAILEFIEWFNKLEEW